jgi:periplasmic nitrate reductase NapD
MRIAPMPEGGWHVSSAVVSVRPEIAAAVIERIEAMDGTEVRGRSGSRIVVVMEGRTAGELGDRLVAIGGLDGVVAANMVFEQALEAEYE